ncbi:MAG: hypothetical protein NTV86_10530 [Planctomycetota bacterium]|nr:hypothetical protein [Planctomycetota bacterium]
MKKTGWIVAVAVIASLAIGCGKDKGADKAGSGAPAATAKTPKDAVLNFAKAFETNDKALLLANVQAGPKELPAIEAMFDMATAMMKFDEKMVKAYGKEAVAKAGVKGESNFPKSADIESKLKVTETGDKAVATMEGEKNPMDLVKVGGAWKIDASAMVSKEKGMDKTDDMAKMSKAMVKAVNEVSENIGKPGTTAESINEEMGKKMMAAMMEMMPKGEMKAPEVPSTPETASAPEVPATMPADK